MKEITLTYQQIIDFKNKCKLPLFYEESYGDNALSKYNLTLKYDSMFLIASVITGTDDFTNFETNYKSLSNIPSIPVSYYKENETSLVDELKANSIIRGYKLNIYSGDTISELNLTWDTNVDILLSKAFLSRVQEGDFIDLFIIPLNDGIVGAITSNSISGQSIISVSSTVIQNVKIGYFLKIGTENNYYEIKSVDIVNNQITLETNLTETKTAGTYVKLRVAFLKDCYVFNNNEFSVGADIAGGMGLPKGYSLHIHYNHISPATSDYSINFNVVYKY